jgi:hypothetical protein
MQIHFGIRAGCATGIAAVLVSMACASAGTSYLPNEQPASIDLPYTANGQIDFDELEKRLKPFRYHTPHPHDRPCKGQTINCQVSLDVVEIGKSNDINPALGPGHFRVIGEFRNKDEKDGEGRYDLKPKTKYYVWVDDTTAFSQRLQSKTIWGLIEYQGAKVTAGYVIKCDTKAHYARATQASYLDFYYCDSSPTKDALYKVAQEPRRNTIYSLTSFVSSSTAALMAAGETWFECDPGCCTGTTSRLQ